MKQTQAESNATAEMCDRIRNRGTMVGKITVDRARLDSIVEERVKQGIIEIFESMSDTILQWKHDNPITIDTDCLNITAVATSNELILKMLAAEIEKLKS